METPEEYYNNENSHGNYQYFSLKDIINTMYLETQQPDSYIKNVSRSKIILHARQAVRNVTQDAANNVLAIEVTVPNSLVWVLPQDYVNYCRISVVEYDSNTGSYRLRPLDINNKINTAIGYLQDDQAEILFDDQGNILQADSLNGYARPYKIYKFQSHYQPTLDTSKLSKHGEFTIDAKRGCILFSSELMDKEVVIEYVSDGLENDLTLSEIKVHKYLKTTIENWIYFSCIERNMNVPQVEKRRALDRYKATLHKAKLAMANFDLLEISRTMRVSQKFN